MKVLKMGYKNVLLTCMIFGILQAAERDASLPSLVPPYYHLRHTIINGSEIYMTEICDNGDESIDYRFLLGEWYIGQDGIFFGFDTSKHLTFNEEQDNLDDTQLEGEERKTYQKAPEGAGGHRKRIGQEPIRGDYSNREDYLDALRDWRIHRKRQARSKKKHADKKNLLINQLVKNGIILKKNSAKSYGIRFLERLLLLGREPLRMDFRDEASYLQAYDRWSDSREQLEQEVKKSASRESEKE
jgi:hypothetical protein